MARFNYQNLIKTARKVSLTVESFAIAGALFLSLTLLAALGISALVYYLYPNRAEQPVSLKNATSLTLDEAKLKVLMQDLQMRNDTFEASTTIATPSAFR